MNACMALIDYLSNNNMIFCHATTERDIFYLETLKYVAWLLPSAAL